MGQSKITQKYLVLDYIDRFGSISSMEAFADLGITRLAARISDLREAGYIFRVEMERKKNRYGKTVIFARYFMEGKINE